MLRTLMLGATLQFTFSSRDHFNCTIAGLNLPTYKTETSLFPDNHVTDVFKLESEKEGFVLVAQIEWNWFKSAVVMFAQEKREYEVEEWMERTAVFSENRTVIINDLSYEWKDFLLGGLKLVLDERVIADVRMSFWPFKEARLEILPEETMPILDEVVVSALVMEHNDVAS